MSDVRTIDEITTHLFESIRNTPCNRRLIEAVEGPSRVTEVSPGVSANVSIVLVPGILYRNYPHTGADGAALKKIAASMSIPLITIPLDGTEGCDVAAIMINTWLQSHIPLTTSIILVSLSKGSTEVMHALTAPGGHAAFQRVSAWISVSGIPFGTPSLELVLRNPFRRAFLRAFCFFKGWKLDNLRNLLRHRPTTLARLLPPHITFIQVTAFSQHGHLNDRRSRRLHRQLAPYGPNDGFALLEELTELPGYMYPVWGVDHYLQGWDDMPARIANLLVFVLQNMGSSAVAKTRT